MKRSLLCALALTAACATIPATSPIERTVTAAEKCSRAGPCFPLHVVNDADYTVDVRLNGVKVGEVTAWGKETLWAREASLRDGRCAQVQLRLQLHGGRGQSDRQCLRPGGYFTLLLDNRGKIVLTPWGGE